MCRHLTCISSPGVMFTKPAAATWTISPPPSPFFSSAMSQTRTQPIHVAITRHIKPGREAEFQKALTEFFKTSFAHTGVQGAAMLVPPPGSHSNEYGIIRTFASEEERKSFYASPAFRGGARPGAELLPTT